MISILIPVYNYDCCALVQALCSQCVSLQETDHSFDFEIIVGDDCSTDTVCKATLSELAQLPNCYVLRQETNIGRAAIRNRLYETSRGDYLLFIDSDAEVVSNDFLSRYYADRNKADVVCGALCNPPEKPYGCELRYKYEIAAERAGQRKASFRMTHPYNMFTTFNVMFRREVFSKIRFDESCREYGYEDVLMGIRLKEESFSILHTDNALLHRGINNNSSFIENTEAGVRTLFQHNEVLFSNSILALTAEKLKRWNCLSLFAIFFKCFRPIIRRNLLSHYPHLMLFKVYKLGYLCQLMHDKQRDL